jgi:2-polyprenyl-3-methyl-5-hydroxy-6-metoxy-1,4-benzoquinol methylase
LKAPRFDFTWPQDVKALYRHDVQEFWDRSIAPQVWNQYHNQLDLYLSLVPTGKRLEILDVGCAQGTLALLLAERGHSLLAVDIRPQFLEYAASRYERGDVRFVCGNALEMEWEPRFDLIFANQLVEHVVFPFDLVRRLAGGLKPGGRLVMTTPNGAYLRNTLPNYRALGDPSKHAAQQCSADGDGHFFAFVADELIEVFEQTGLTRVTVRFFETPWISGHMRVRYLHSRLPVRLLRVLDRATLTLPGVARRAAHQLMVQGSRGAS